MIRNNVSANAAEMGRRLMDGLNGLMSRHAAIDQVRGMGLLVAVQFTGDISGQVVSMSNDEGLLLNPVRPNAIRIMPPLTLSADEVDEGIAKLDRAITRATAD